MDAGGASAIVTEATDIGETGAAHLVLSATASLPQHDIVLIETTGTGPIGGKGIFDTMDGGPFFPFRRGLAISKSSRHSQW